ncbi:MAG TPA: response regulator transcription factor [Methylomirabilota bacterium]|nr:response regulator transcription factor [Methylomirabilota bacterium]
MVGTDAGMQAGLVVLLGRRFGVDVAGTASEGLGRLGVAPPRLVVLASRLPDLDSAHFLRALRARLPACPVIVVTDGEERENLRELLTLRVEGLLQKPPYFESLLEQISRLTDDGGGPAGGLRFSRYVNRVLDHVSLQYAVPGSHTELAEAVGLSASHLAYVFRRETGMTLKEYSTKVRIEVARQLLARTEAKLDVIAQQIGFCDACHFCRVFRRHVGCSPGLYRLRLRSPSLRSAPAAASARTS